MKKALDNKVKIFMTIGKNLISNLDNKEAAVWLRLIGEFNVIHWKHIRSSMSDLEISLHTERQSLKLILQKLVDKNFIKMTIEGKAHSKVYVLCVADRFYTWYNGMETNSIGMETNSIGMETNSIGMETNSIEMDHIRSNSSAPMSAACLKPLVNVLKDKKEAKISGLADNASLLTVNSNSNQNKTVLPITTHDDASLQNLDIQEISHSLLKTDLPITTHADHTLQNLDIDEINKTVLPITTNSKTPDVKAASPIIYPKTVNIDNVPYLIVKLSYKDILDNKTLGELKSGKIKIPCHQLPNLTNSNELAKLDNWKNEHRPSFVEQKKIMINDLKVVYEY